MPPRRKLSARQMEILIEFAESNRDVALGRFSGGPLSSQTNKQAWESFAVQVNAVPNGVTKTPDQWRRYWIEYKAKTKTKAADIRRSASATGGGPNKLTPLNEFEERVLAIIGPVAVEGLPGVRIPINIPTSNEGPSSAPILNKSADNLVHSVAMDEEWLEELQESIPDIAAQEAAQEEVEQEVAQEEAAQEEAAQEESAQEVAVSRERTPVNQPAPLGQRSRSQRLTQRRDERVPRWAYDLEERRISAEERLATAVEAMVEILQNIRNDIQHYLQ